MNDYSKITYKGNTHSLSEWSEVLGIKYATLRARITKGMSVKDAFTRPVKPSPGNRKHGMCGKKEYRAWQSIRERCLGRRSKMERYARYGGRGIGVCKRWDKFQKFYLDVGAAPSKHHSLGRLNNDGDYCPSNCQWQSNQQQSNNRRTSVFIKYRGETKTLAEWSRHLEIPYDRFRSKMKRRGGPTARALKKVMGEWRAPVGRSSCRRSA